MTDYPECDKLAAIQEKSQNIGEFLEWLQSGEVSQNLPIKRSIFLASYDVVCEDGQGKMLHEDDWELGDRMMPFAYSTDRLLANFFGIDLDKVDKEKRAMLEEIKAQCEEKDEVPL